MDKINKMKDEYKAICAPNEVKSSVSRMLAQKKRRHIYINRIMSTAAMLMLVFVLSVNLSPNVAKAMSDVPVLGMLTRVVTLGRYVVEEDGYEIDVTTPKLEGLLDKEMEEELNRKFAENSAVLIAAIEADIAQLKAEYGDENVHMGVQSGYFVKTDNENHLAIDVYIENIVGSSSTVHDFYTIDRKSGTLVTFASLFKEDTDYVSVIDEYIRGEMERINNEEDGMYSLGEDGFETVGNEPKFYINDSGNIVVCFDKYEVAAGAQGSPEFELPADVVEGIVK